MTPSDVLEFAKKHGAKFVDFKFMDFPGVWQHVTMPIQRLKEETFEDGYGFDGSSIRGWQPINLSDMLFIPDADTAKMDPFTEVPTLSLICCIFDPITKEPYTRDPRGVARKAEQHLKASGLGDVAYFGPEPEHFIFDDVRFDSQMNQGYYHLDSVEGRWNSGREEFPNLGYKPSIKGGYFPVPPTDTLLNIRNEISLIMQEQLGYIIELHHHEVATGGQGEINTQFAPLVAAADTLCWLKYVTKNVARKHGKVATFMPKPLFGDNGSGMHTHQSIWKNEKPLFAGDQYGGLSEMALYYIGGILKHAPALCALTNPGTNSYKRLVPGFEAPINLAYSARNRSAAVRIPVGSNSPKAKRLEFRTPDPSCNPYLAFSAMLMAGIDGIQNKIKPGDPLDKDIYALSPEELKDIPKAPGALDEALNNLRRDHAFLLKGDVFTKDVIETWIDWKWENEVNPMRLRPHPYEFSLYFDI